MSELRKIMSWENRKRIGFVSVFILVVLILGLVKGMSLRAEKVTLGDVEFELDDNGYYMVEEEEQLLILGQIDTDTNKKFKLANDIEVGTVSKAATSTFAGEFDGQDFKITYKEIKIETNSDSENDSENHSEAEGILFGTVTGKVENLFVEVGSVDYKFTDTYQPKLDEDTEVTFTSDSGEQFLDPEEDETKILDEIRQTAYVYNEGAYVEAQSIGVNEEKPELEQIYYYKQELRGTVSKSEVKREKKKKKVYFGLVGAVLKDKDNEAGGSINNLHIEGETIAAATVENEYCYGVSYKDQSDMTVNRYYEVSYTGKLLTKSVQIPEKYAYLYVTEDGNKFDLDRPLYENGKPKYEQEEDEYGVFWFIEKDNPDKKISRVYGSENQAGKKEKKDELVTQKVVIPEKYAFLYAYDEDEKEADFNIPLYKNGKAIYEQFEDESGKFWFHIPQNGDEEDKKYPVYDDGAQEVRTQYKVIKWMTRKVVVGGVEKYAYQYAVKKDTFGNTENPFLLESFDFNIPLYDAMGKPIYERDDNNEYWISTTKDEDGNDIRISLIYDPTGKAERAIKESKKITKEVAGEEKFAYQYAFENKKFDYKLPLYKNGVSIYRQYVDLNGDYWFIIGNKKYPVYDTAGTAEQIEKISVLVVKTINQEKKYAYRYAMDKDGDRDDSIPLYDENGKAKGRQYVDTNGKYWMILGENKYPMYDTDSDQLQINEEFKVSKKEPITDWNLKELINTMRKEERLITAADLYVGAVAGQVINGTISGIIQKVAVDGQYVPGNNVQEREKSSLFIGGITGFTGTSATVKDCYITKQMTVSQDIEDVVIDYRGDITGISEGKPHIGYFIIDNGSGGIISGSGDVTCENGYTTSENGGKDISTINPERLAQNKEMKNWQSFSKDITGENDVYTLKWLFKNNCGYSHSLENDATKIDLILDLNDPKNNENSHYGTMKYCYRPSINEAEKEETIKLTETKSVSIQNDDLESSAYLYVKNMYYTDGKYYYYKEFTDKEYIYPYMEETEFFTSYEELLVREADQDYIQIKGNMPQSGSSAVFYYTINSDKIPVKENTDNPEKYDTAQSVAGSIGEDGIWKANILFDRSSMRLNGFWTLDGKIYPIFTSGDYDDSLREAMEAPKEFSISRYYKDDEFLTPFYTNLPVDSEGQIVYAGQNIRIEEYNENKKIEYLCLFSTKAEIEDEDDFHRGGVNYSHDLTSGVSNLSIPDSFNADEEFYLHIMKYRKQVAGGIATLKLKMTSVNEIKPSKASNSVVVNGSSILLDIGKLDGSDGMKGIRYRISSEPSDKNTLLGFDDVTKIEYTPGAKIEIKLEREDDKVRKYLYVQYYGTYDNEDICGQLQVMEYVFADKTGNPLITPNTIMLTSEAGALGAFTCYTNTKVSLSAAENSTIIYCLGESEAAELSVAKVIDDSILKLLDEKAQKARTCVLMKRLYVQNNGFWYMMSEGAEVYQADEGIMLSNQSGETKHIYVGAIAFEEDKEYSDAVHYVYELEPQEETAAPTAVLQTSAEEPASVTLHSSLFFQSITPDAELYYTLDGTMPGTAEGGSTKKYDRQKGILVDGEYSGLFRIKMIAVKKDSSGEIEFKPSETVSFIYRIEEQNTVTAPVSIPATTEENPTVLSPGHKILLSTSTNGAVIYYTVDGTEPKVNNDGSVKNGIRYDAGTGIIMPEDGEDFFTIKAIAVKSGLKNSAVAQLTFCYPDKVLPPYASLASGVVNSGTAITLTNTTDGATIYYEIAYENSKPKTPTITSAIFDSEQPFIITKKTTIKAIAVKDGVKSKVETFTYSTSKLSNVPTASITSGSVVSRGTKLNITSESGSAIYYTTDGSDPTEVPNTNVVAGQSLLLDGEYGSVITVKASAKAANKAFSEVASFTYQISRYQGGVTSGLESGTEVSSGATVNLMSDISNARIYYTIDGTSPSAGSASGTAVTLSGEPGTIVTVKAMAIPEGVTVDAAGSSTAIFNYKIKDTITAPEASPAGGTLTSQISVTLTAAKGDIYYTTDGSTPTINSTRYKDPITVNKSMVIKAIAATNEGEVSEVSTFTYSTAMRAAKPESSAADGVLEPGTVVTLSSQTNGAVIYYSTDGTTPGMDNLDSLLIYDGEGITVNRTVSIKAAAYKDGYLLSNTAAFYYEVTKVPAEIEREKRAAEEAEKGLKETDATGLKDKSGSNTSGPSFSGIILKETKFETMVSAEKGIIPENARLIVTDEKCPDSVLINLQALLGEQYEMLSIYDMSLYEDSQKIEPNGKMEIGIPIPEEYENAAIQIVYVDQDGNIKRYETRRSDGMAYAVTDHFSLYGLAGVKNEEKNKFTVDAVYLIVGSAIIVTAVGVGFFCFHLARKKRPKGGGGIFDTD